MGGWHRALPSPLVRAAQNPDPPSPPPGHTRASQAAAWAPRTPLFPLASGSEGWGLQVVPGLAGASRRRAHEDSPVLACRDLMSFSSSSGGMALPVL